MKIKPNVAIIGSGPAGLMAATVLASQGYKVRIFEKRPSAGRKILIAGSSGLNVSFDSSIQDMIQNYKGPRSHWECVLNHFTPKNWLDFIGQLGLETFRGTSKRFFVSGMKGSGLLRAWVDFLKLKGVEFVFNRECKNFASDSKTIQIELEGPSLETEKHHYSAVCFCLGGGSWEPNEKPLRWPALFRSKNLKFNDFYSANSGFKVDWTEAFLKEAEGLPLKNIVFYSQKGSRPGEIVITRYGIEGTPVYALGKTGEAWIDLKPSLSESEILTKFNQSKEKLSPIRKATKLLKLSEAALALAFHYTPKEILNTSTAFIKRLKRFPIHLGAPQPLEEAISSSGGLDWEELDSSLMLKKHPGVFAAGEMIDWDAPTGGYLIQGCVSQGNWVGHSILKYLKTF